MNFLKTFSSLLCRASTSDASAECSLRAGRACRAHEQNPRQQHTQGSSASFPCCICICRLVQRSGLRPVPMWEPRRGGEVNNFAHAPALSEGWSWGHDPWPLRCLLDAYELPFALAIYDYWGWPGWRHPLYLVLSSEAGTKSHILLAVNHSGTCQLATWHKDHQNMSSNAQSSAAVNSRFYHGEQKHTDMHEPWQRRNSSKSSYSNVADCWALSSAACQFMSRASYETWMGSEYMASKHVGHHSKQQLKRRSAQNSQCCLRRGAIRTLAPRFKEASLINQ